MVIDFLPPVMSNESRVLLEGATGGLPNAQQRRRMIELVDALPAPGQQDG